jgi:hypothetical protein
MPPGPERDRAGAQYDADLKRAQQWERERNAMMAAAAMMPSTSSSQPTQSSQLDWYHQMNQLGSWNNPIHVIQEPSISQQQFQMPPVPNLTGH